MDASVALEAQTLEEWRATMFEELGFSAEQAASLAVAKQDDGWPIALAHVSKLIENGCPHELVLRIVQ